MKVKEQESCRQCRFWVSSGWIDYASRGGVEVGSCHVGIIPVGALAEGWCIQGELRDGTKFSYDKTSAEEEQYEGLYVYDPTEEANDYVGGESILPDNQDLW